MIGQNYQESETKELTFSGDSLDSFKKIRDFLYQNIIYFEDILILSKVILMQEKLIVDRLDQEILKTFNKDYFSQFKHARSCQFAPIYEQRKFKTQKIFY